MMSDQNPHPGDMRHSQICVVCLTPPPPLELDIDRCIIIVIIIIIYNNNSNNNIFLIIIIICNKNCQVLVKSLNFVAGMTRRFISAKRLIIFYCI